MTVSLKRNFFSNARGITFLDANGITWALNASTNQLTASYSGAGSSGGANPSAKVGLSAVNGSAATFMRSDAAPPVDQGIAPTWTALHTFSAGISTGNETMSSVREKVVWTPSLQIGGTAPASQMVSGYYSRHGSLVAAHFSVTLSTLSSLTGAVAIAGLPVTPNTINGVVLFSYFAGLAAGYTPVAYVQNAGSIQLGKYGSTSFTGLTNSDLTAASRFDGVAIYMA